MKILKFALCFACFFSFKSFGQIEFKIDELIKLNAKIHKDYIISEVIPLVSDKGREWNTIDLDWERHWISDRYKRRVYINGLKFDVTIYKESLATNLYYAEISDQGIVDSTYSFYFLQQLNPIIIAQRERLKNESPIMKYKNRGYKVVSSTSSGNTKIVVMGHSGGGYVTLHIVGGKIKSTSYHNAPR